MIPLKVFERLKQIRAASGAPTPGYTGGDRFRNDERRLPPGNYRGYDVDPLVAGKDRGSERLIIEQETGAAYYTMDHYRTFATVIE